MADSEMVERVARAIYDEGRPPHEGPWPGRHPNAFRSAAQAAIKAMREPPKGMEEDIMPWSDWIAALAPNPPADAQ